MKKGLNILIALVLLLGCSASQRVNQTADLSKLEIGETVYVCGCPMMCCNTISRTRSGQCACNHPLNKGTVSKIRDGRIYVKIDDGREKRFFIENR